MGKFAQQQGQSVHGHGYMGLSWGAASLRGWCPRNDDTFVAGEPAGLVNHAVFGVFDGHGLQGGDKAARLVSRGLHRLIFAEHRKSGGLSEEKLAKAFNSMDLYLRRCRPSKKTNFKFSGTCAAVVVVGNADIVIANLGDSEVVGKKGRLTRIHNCEDPYEASRIITNGGFICNDQRVNGRLIPTRAFGDFCLKKGLTKDKPILSCTPEITRIPRKDAGEFIVVGSDGIFDALSESSVIEYCEKNRHLTSKQLAEHIVDRAIGCGSQDNATCIVIRLSDPLRRSASATAPVESSIRTLGMLQNHS